MLLGPWSYFCGRPTDRHPLQSGSSSSHPSHIDFWGPCLVVSLYGSLLWFGRVRDVPWLFVIWSLGGVFNHLICRVWFSPSNIMMHTALLGYSVTPMIPLAGIIILFRPQVWLIYCIEIFAVLWCSFAAILSYVIICNAPSDKKHRLSLLIPSVVLLEMYIISLLPIRR